MQFIVPVALRTISLEIRDLLVQKAGFALCHQAIAAYTAVKIALVCYKKRKCGEGFFQKTDERIFRFETISLRTAGTLHAPQND